jgi:peroxiredoxin
MPDFQQARIEYADTDLEIIAINATHQDSLADVERFVQQNMLEFPILLDSGGNASHSYQIHSLPTTFIIDREGVIIKTLIGGPVPLSLLRIEANQLLEGISDVTNH